MSGVPGIDPTVPPAGTGCSECLGGDGPGWWFHLRRCAQCGHIGCCDSSPMGHARIHAAESGHPIVQSFEPGENWFWSFEEDEFYRGPALTPPTARPASQPSPGPEGAVPPDWQTLLR
ncbi:MAG: UBP-type zinc finger domain-containing protein [Thermoleophilia bacterium]